MNKEEFSSQALELVRARIGITSNVRDGLLTATINAVVDELENQNGLSLNPDSAAHLMFVVDYATWRYQSVSDKSLTGSLPMPRHLQYRLHNLILSAAGGATDV